MNVKIFAVSHSEKLLEHVPQQDSIMRVLLSDLDVKTEFRGESLAENRFLLTDLLINHDAEYCGFVTARWDEKFDWWPQLSEMSNLLIHEPRIKSPALFAPAFSRVGPRQLKFWIQNQDSHHPGMTALLHELVRLHDLQFETRDIRTIVMANNFIVPKDVAKELLRFWQSSFAYLYGKYGLVFPFSYRCPKCGLEDSNGLDRYTRVRHAGFLLERVTTLFFLSRPDLKPHSPENGGFSPVENTFTLRLRDLSLNPKVIQPFILARAYLNGCREGHVVGN